MLPSYMKLNTKKINTCMQLLLGFAVGYQTVRTELPVSGTYKTVGHQILLTKLPVSGSYETP